MRHRTPKDRIYSMWASMKRRCLDPKDTSWKNYGGRGITVYGPWRKDFNAFYEYVRALPAFGKPGLMIDRIDNDHGYFPGNLRWATRLQQANNKRNSIRIRCSADLAAKVLDVKKQDPICRFVKPKELAVMLNVSHEAIRSWIFRRWIPVTRFGRAVRIRLEVAEKIAREGLQKDRQKGED
jgi:excisionase family DNA binding protein